MSIYDDEIDLRPYIFALTRKWWLILIVTVLATGAAFVYSILQVRNYESSATILLTRSRASLSLANQFPTVNEPIDSRSRMDAMLAIAGSDSLVMQAMEDIHQEYPATPEEAFTAAQDGTYWAKRYLEMIVRRGQRRTYEELYDHNLDMYIAIDTSKSTLAGELNNLQTAANNGNVDIDLNIRGTNSDTWTLSGTAGANQYVHKFSKDSGISWTALTTSGQTLAIDIGTTGTQTFDLQITTPTSSADYIEHSVDVTIIAIAS